MAVKILPPDLSADPDRLARLEHEARTVAALNHPGIVTLHAVEEAGAMRFLVYEMASGVRAFHGDSSADVMSAGLKDDPMPLEELKPALPARFTKIVKRCLEKDPRGRAQSAIDLLHELQDLAEELRPVPAHPPAVSAPVLPGITPAKGARPRTTSRWAALATAVVGLLVVGTLEVGRWQRGATTAGGATPIRSLAVLPFENRMRDPSQGYYVDGMHEAIIAELVRLGGVEVKSRRAVMKYRGTTLPIRSVARELGVDAVIDGSVLRTNQSVRISASLVLGANDQSVWEKSYDGGPRDVLRLQDEVSSAIASEIPRVRPDAYEAYLRARSAVSLSVGPKQVLEARQHLLLATSLDPGFAPAWGALSSTYLVDVLFSPNPETRSQAASTARRLARQALDLSAEEGQALAALGMVQLYYDWDFEGARRKLERAVVLNPHESLLRHGWADDLMVTGRFDESLEQTRLGRSYDPMSPLMAGIATFHAMAARRFEGAIADGRRALLLTPPRDRMVSGLHTSIGEALWQQQKYDEAVVELKAAASADPAGWAVFEDTYRRSGPQAALRAYSSRVAASLVNGGGGDPVAVAAAFAEAGDGGRAIEWLERGYNAHEPTMLHVPANVAFDSLRDDPRFQALLRQIGIRMPSLPAK